MPKKPYLPFPMKDEWKPTYKYPLMRDEASDFNSDQLCFYCGHLIYFMHTYSVYKADDENEPDLMVWRCTEKDCECISAIPIISKN